MYGKNKVIKSFPSDDGSLKVNSVWYTIQGEGPDAGRPAVFVRLSHCNLRCFFCDTEFESGEVFTLRALAEEIVGLSQAHNCTLVVITGGEPFLQNIIPLVYELNQNGISVSVETAGTVYRTGLDQFFDPFGAICKNLIVCSPKTKKLYHKVIPLIGALKYVVRVGEISDIDGLPSMSTQKEGAVNAVYRPCSRLSESVPIYVQPMDDVDKEHTQSNMELAAKVCMRYGYRLSLQMHKLVGVE